MRTPFQVMADLSGRVGNPRRRVVLRIDLLLRVKRAIQRGTHLHEGIATYATISIFMPGTTSAATPMLDRLGYGGLKNSR